MTELPEGTTATSLQDEARRRAEARRASGELPADLDDRLRDDTIRALRRSADRGPIDTSSAIDRATRFAAVDPSTATGPRQVLSVRLKRIVGRLSERTHLIDAISAVDSEQRRQARIVDDTAASLDALAARITALERWAAVPGLGSLPGPAIRTTTSDVETVESLDQIALLELLDDGADPSALIEAAHRGLRRGGRLVVHTDRPQVIVDAFEGWLEVWVESLRAPEPLTGSDSALVDRLNELLGLDGRDRVIAIR